MKRFSGVSVPDDRDYVEYVVNYLNIYEKFYTKYRAVTVQGSPLDIACGLILKDDYEKYHNFLCEIHFDNKDHDIAVELCYVYDYKGKKDKLFYIDDVNVVPTSAFADCIVRAMDDYLGFKN